MSVEQVGFAQNQATKPIFISNSQRTLIDPLAKLKIRERPNDRNTPSGAVYGSSRQGRKRVGFYASLCNDVGALDLGSCTPRSSNNECSQSHRKPKKKPKQQRGSKYYSSLAEDVAAMKLHGQGGDKGADVQSSVTRSEDEDLEKQTVGKCLQGGSEGPDMNGAMEDVGRVSLHDDEPPTWFSKALDIVGGFFARKLHC